MIPLIFSQFVFLRGVIPILNHDDIEAPRKERRRCTVAVHRETDDEGNKDSAELERFAEISTDSCLAEPILSQALRESLGYPPCDGRSGARLAHAEDVSSEKAAGSGLREFLKASGGSR